MCFFSWIWNPAPTSCIGGQEAFWWGPKSWSQFCWKIFKLKVSDIFLFHLFVYFVESNLEIHKTFPSPPQHPPLNASLPGVAYTSECFRCNPGTFSRAPGSSSCDPCPRDTFSGHGASSCTPCNASTQYAGTALPSPSGSKLSENLEEAAPLFSNIGYFRWWIFFFDRCTF